MISIGMGWQRVRNYWKRLPIERRGIIAILLPLGCLMGAVIADTILRTRMIEAQQYVDRTNQVLMKSQSTLVRLLNAETGVRGYYIGRERLFLEPYEDALRTLEPTLIDLEKLVQDNPSQVQQVKRLDAIARERMSLLQAAVERVEEEDASGFPVVRQRLLTGKQAMDQFRITIEEFEVEERRILDIRTRSLQDKQSFNANAMWFGIVLSLFGTALTIRLLQQLGQELRERERRLSESRNLIEAIVANVIDGVMVINAQGNIESFNAAASTMFGYCPTEVVGWPWQRLLKQEPDSTQRVLYYSTDAHRSGSGDPTADHPTADHPTTDHRRTSMAPPVGEIWQAMGQRKSGECFPIEASMNSIVLDNDRIVIIRDITSRQEVAAKLQAKAIQLADLNHSLKVSNQSLLQSNRELDQFAYITSHDLKAPLRAIANLSEWIEEDMDALMGAGLTDGMRSNMHLLRSRVGRMQSLLNSLLEYSRAGRHLTPITVVDVHGLLTEIIQTLDPPDTFTTVIVAPMPTLLTRRQPLQQVFTHLIDNAIRHHPTKMGMINISVVDLGDRYEFAISDNGDGIDPQFQERIYTIFQTLKARDVQENMGAGLAIIKKIVTAEGGIIRLESTAGSGATFRFTWLKQSPHILPHDKKSNAKYPPD